MLSSITYAKAFEKDLLMNKKIKNEISECCAFCERAAFTEDEDVMYCQKKKSNVDAGACCRGFSYDLLKRKPSPQKSPLALDPSLLQF